MINTQIQRIYTINTLIIINFVNCDVSNVVNISVFLRLFFNNLASKYFNYVVVKIIIFNFNLFDFSHFICLVNCCFTSKHLFQVPAKIKKISTYSANVNCKIYLKQHSIHCARTTFLTIFIFSKSYSS